jgi:hypothetical protein
MSSFVQHIRRPLINTFPASLRCLSYCTMTLGLEQVRDALEGLTKPKRAKLVELKSRNVSPCKKVTENKKAV